MAESSLISSFLHQGASSSKHMHSFHIKHKCLRVVLTVGVWMTLGVCLITMTFLPTISVERSIFQDMEHKRRIGGAASGGVVVPHELVRHQVAVDLTKTAEKQPESQSDQESNKVKKENNPAPIITSDSKSVADRNRNNLQPGDNAVSSTTKPLAPVGVVANVVDAGNDSNNKNNNIDNNNINNKIQDKYRQTPDGRIIADLQQSDLKPDDPTFCQKPIARGVAGRPLDQTPSVRTARRAHVECDLNVDSVAYWNVDDHDDEFQPQPFVATTRADVPEKFITFTPDKGGWNNVRISLEIIFVIAAATKRTLVLPPREYMYLFQIDRDKKNIYRGFGDFFPLQALGKRVKVISFIDYLNSTASPPIPAGLQDLVYLSADHCVRYWDAVDNCTYVYEYLRQTGTLMNICSQDSRDTCLVFDEEAYQNGGWPPKNDDIRAYVAAQCGIKRKVVYWNAADYNDPPVLFFDAGNPEYRLLNHYYNMIHFTSPRLSHYYKRFVRDYLHYHDAIYCAAGKVVKALQAESALMLQNSNNDNPLMVPDDEGAGGYSAMHVRRGELQYDVVKISAQEWYNNTQEIWLPSELLYVATDERNKSWFTDIAKHHPIRFLDDYWELAGLQKVDPNYMGMIDTIVASRGRAFVGTYYSTFSAYINRLRGYHGISLLDSYYNWLPAKFSSHYWGVMKDRIWEIEYPDGWVGIDADVWPSKEKY